MRSLFEVTYVGVMPTDPKSSHLVPGRIMFMSITGSSPCALGGRSVRSFGVEASEVGASAAC